MRHNLRALSLVLAGTAMFVADAQATVLIFKDASNNDLSMGTLGNYGDNVTATPEAGFSYGTGGSITPNVTVAYAGAMDLFGSGYGSLGNVLYGSNGNPYSLTFTADPGFSVVLESFKLAGYGGATRSIDSITVSNGGVDPAYALSGVAAPGAAFNLVNLTGQAAATGQSVTLTFLSSSYFDETGTSEFQFSQSAVPEPASFAVLGMASIALMRRRR